MIHVVKVKPLPQWRLEITFSDGNSGEISLEDRLFGPKFEPLRDTSFFSLVKVDEFGAICWPNGADLAPDALHRRLYPQTASPVSTSH